MFLFLNYGLLCHRAVRWVFVLPTTVQKIAKDKNVYSGIEDWKAEYARVRKLCFCTGRWWGVCLLLFVDDVAPLASLTCDEPTQGWLAAECEAAAIRVLCTIKSEAVILWAPHWDSCEGLQVFLSLEVVVSDCTGVSLCVEREGEPSLKPKILSYLWSQASGSDWKNEAAHAGSRSELPLCGGWAQRSWDSWNWGPVLDAPPSWKESLELGQALDKDACWTPPFRDLSNWAEALGQSQSMLEGVLIPSGRGKTRGPPGGAG